MSESIIYEHPLSEHVRSLLRIEHLFDCIDRYSNSQDARDTRLTLFLLLELSDLLIRSDIKSELAKDLEIHLSTLSALEGNPGVDTDRLREILDEVAEYHSTLQDEAYQPGALLDSNDLIASIKQKHSVAGGACGFDLPAYHLWLNKPAETRQRHLREWQEDLLTIRKGAELTLDMFRNNPSLSRETAEGGFFQKSIETKTAGQLIRIILPADSEYFPETSGGKHRFSVRFMEQNLTADKPTQTQEDVEFELHYCVL